MKILFIGDFSGMHATLAQELRRQGHEAVVASDGSQYMDTTRDIDISRQPGFFGSVRYLNRLFSLLPSMSGYDVVQIINPNFLHLKPGKIRYFFNQLKRNNGKIFLSVAGSDPVTVKACVEDGLYRYSEYRIGKERSPFATANPYEERRWINGLMGDHCRFIYENVDGAVSALYEYHIAAARYLGDKISYGGIPVDTSALKFEPMRFDDGRVNILVGIKKEYELFKGTDRLLAAALEVERRHPDKCVVTKVENVSFDDYLSALRRSHVVLDQLYSYTPATNALQTMALGKVAVSGGEPEYYDFIGEKDLHPVVNVIPDDDHIIGVLEKLVSDRERLALLGRQSREFVERHNAASVVAARYMDAWRKVL